MSEAEAKIIESERYGVDWTAIHYDDVKRTLGLTTKAAHKRRLARLCQEDGCTPSALIVRLVTEEAASRGIR
jgi:hypothetical protein